MNTPPPSSSAFPGVAIAGQDGHVSYQGQLLIAMPGLSAPPFDHSVIYLCHHDADHAMGLILNQPISGLNFARMMQELGLKAEDRQAGELADMKIYRGGPVQNDRGFVLHSLDYQLDDITVDLGGPEVTTRGGEMRGLGLTVSRDILVDLSSGSGPARTLIALGYAGWGPGQLEEEISGNAWLIVPAQEELIFMRDPDQMWSAAVASLGITPGHLSGAAGNA
ncbi:YqgE/AlgH family protein [Asticcacaulis sp. EMRT-3]|uniref:YqgE/AlgH family protein n=1 Tax=Asticcacaulis sp. EMRT-3 TaxID=3040349 RepID=UPI0024AEE2EC|nr:YqgE/AlgH family protein [Asticcacaulis sp. EMRT-3]MDI7774804.1 YqgE/AlgH family protein [Asticcacaulis sp. EMRT-3]